jgi:polyisoprenoid-binding protein YceI
MVKRVVTILSLMLLFTALSKAERWDIDVVHSTVGFTVRHMVVTKVHGRFSDFTGKIDFNGKNIEKGAVEMTVQVASLNTDNQKRDDHLKSPDFFDVEKFPTMTFKSKKIIKGEGNKFKLVGDLTIRGVSKEVTFDCEFNGVVTDPMGNTRAGFSAQTKINRQDFNVKWNKKLDAGGLVVGDEVTINLEIEAVKAKS